VSILSLKNDYKMKGKNSFGVHFILRQARSRNGKSPIYARISVNGSRSEITVKAFVDPDDWNDSKGAARPKSDELRELNNYLETRCDGGIAKVFWRRVDQQWLLSICQLQEC